MSFTKSLLQNNVSERLKGFVLLTDSQSSGALVELALQFLPEEEFLCLRDMMENDEAMIDCLGDLVRMVASKLQVKMDMCQYMIALKNVVFMLYCESLRRRGMLNYAIPQNIFLVARDEDKCYLTAQGIIEYERREVHIL